MLNDVYYFRIQNIKNTIIGLKKWVWNEWINEYKDNEKEDDRERNGDKDKDWEEGR